MSTMDRPTPHPSAPQWWRVKRYTSLGVRYLILGIVAIVMIVPLLMALDNSLKPDSEIFAVPFRVFPSHIVWKNYVVPFQQDNFGRYFINSLIMAATQTAGALLFCSMAGYSLAKFNYPGRNVLFFFILSTIMIPIQVTLVPLYLVVKDLGWVNTYQGLIVPGLATTFGTFLMRQFFMTVPNDYMDAGRIDGAGEFRIFWGVMLPMCRPALSALAILSFTGSWSSFLWPLVVATNDTMRTVPLGILYFLGAQRAPAYGQLMAVAVIATFPVFVLFLVMQRQFTRGAMLAGLKG